MSNQIKYKHGRKTITNDIAYIAGFFDGEGCVRIKKANQGGNSYYIWVAITNSNKDILEFIENLFGGNIRKAERTPNKTIYHYLITSSEAVEFLKLLYPFLKEKRIQAQMAIQFHTWKDKLTPELQERYYLEMRTIKRVNIYENPELLEKQK